MLDLTIIIVNWNGKEVLPACLEAVSQQTWKSFRTLVVDNGSTDDSVKICGRFGNRVETIKLQRNMGFCGANNIALRTVTTPYVALLNNDAFPEPDWLEAMVSGLEKYPEAGFAACKLLLDKERDVIDRAGDGYSLAGAAYLRGRGAPSFRFDEEEMVFGACAAAALYRTEMLRSVGLFDEDFFLLHEDVDLSFRAQLMGYKCVYLPQAVVYHGASSTLGRDSATSVYFGHRNLEWVYLKNMPWPLLLRSFWLHVVYDLFAFAFFLRIGRGADFVKAKRDALVGLPLTWKKRKRIQARRKVSNEYILSILVREHLFQRYKYRTGDKYGNVQCQGSRIK